MSEEKKRKPAKAATTETAEKPAAAVVVKKATSNKSQYVKGIQYIQDGKRKNATARVVLRPGSGKFLINDKHNLMQYFGNRVFILTHINKPLKVAGMENQYDILANLDGGGKSGQAGALAHAIAKAIVDINPDLKKQLKIEGLITRDSRVKESKKYGRKKARKGYTYRKR